MPPIPTRIQSVSRATALLELVAADAAGLTASQAASAIGVPLPTAYHLLNTLIDAGFLLKTTGRRYQLGPRIGLLAEAFLSQISAPEYLTGHVRELARRTGETAYLSAWRNGESVLLSVVEGHRAVRVAGLHLGYAGDAHVRASGKVLLATGHAAQVARYLDSHDIPRRPGQDLDGATALRRELELVRLRGVGVDEEEFAEGVVCIAAPVVDGSLALGISTPAQRYATTRDDLIAAVVSVASAARACVPAAAEAG